ncbi:hypothetical protein K3172_02940 [Qipengyuania sp. 6B39]|uniref:hypothetical protein n=1 Tax=Qipengyuania proteolytica TaxID=2867239 RepID=UPI001C8AE24A|nr:hypothetical protein [Qipengyuania proteolytica]MBX7494810.1 hypothetical protein [Qipengyuania proteolytica]
MTIRLALALPALGLLAACSGDQPEAVDPISATEQQALDDAAEMIEQRRLPPEALAPQDETGTAAEEDNEDEQ